MLHPADVPFFTALCRRPGKPVNFVPVIDADVRRWWRPTRCGRPTTRATPPTRCASSPGTVAVAGITEVDEPVGDLLDRFERATTDELLAAGAAPTRGREPQRTRPRPEVCSASCCAAPGRAVGLAPDPQPACTASATSPTGRSTATAPPTPRTGATLNAVDAEHAELTVPLLADRAVRIRITVPASTRDGGAPVVTAADAEAAMSALLGVAAGQDLPAVKNGARTRQRSPGSPTWSPTTPASPAPGCPSRSTIGASAVPDVVVGACWPAVFAVLGAADHRPTASHVIEGMLDLVHLDHAVDMVGDDPDRDQRCSPSKAESVAVVDTDMRPRRRGRTSRSGPSRSTAPPRRPFATLVERFVIRGRTGTGELADPAGAGGSRPTPSPTPRAAVAARSPIVAPHHMGAFAAVSGDHNPIHTVRTPPPGSPGSTARSCTACGSPPWRSAPPRPSAPRTTRARSAAGLTRWVLPLLPGAEVEITVERTGVIGGDRSSRSSCRADGELGDGRLRPSWPRRGRRTPSPARASRARAWASRPAPAPRPPARSGTAPTRTPARRSASRSSRSSATTRPSCGPTVSCTVTPTACSS